MATMRTRFRTQGMSLVQPELPLLNVTARGFATIHLGWARALARVRPRQLAPLCMAQAIRACSL